jgi:ABC-type transporter Mla subunit MlaD
VINLLPLHTIVFCLLIALATYYFGHMKYDRFATTYGAEILTTMGILGCFVGIALGLWDFDTRNVQESVPELLDGIKTAFFSSVFGVSGALYLRFLQGRKKPAAPSSVEDIKVASLDDVVTAVVALRDGLVGDEQGTLLTQIKLQRQESKDKLDELVREFQNFAKHMAENNQKALIEALKTVIADFNAKLTEQFGENFKQLNSAVEKLVVWQQQYKEELDQLKSYQEKSASDFRSAADTLATVVSKAEKFAEIAEALQKQLRLAEAQVDTLHEQEKALAALLTSMENVPYEIAESLRTLLSDLNTGVGDVQEEIKSLVAGLRTDIQSHNTELKTLLVETLAKSNKEMGEANKKQLETITESVITLDESLQKTLNDSLEILGRQLASLSTKFVEDYSPLTDKLREVVQMAKRV